MAGWLWLEWKLTCITQQLRTLIPHAPIAAEKPCLPSARICEDTSHLGVFLGRMPAAANASPRTF